MATKELRVRVKHAYLSAAEWVSKNPILQAGELGIESDTQKYKIGDGVIKWSNLSYVSGITVDAELSDTSTNPVQNKVVKMNMDILYTNVINKLAVVNSKIPTKVSALENDAGYLTQHQSLDGYAKTSVVNTWTAQQTFQYLTLANEKYNTYVVNGTTDKPLLSTMAYNVTGAFTLDLATLAGRLSAGQSSVFTAYFSANGDYSLTITNAGTLKYIGSASDVAITSSGLLLNILMTKDNHSYLTSIVQASKLS